MYTIIIIGIGLFLGACIPIILFWDDKQKEDYKFQCTKCLYIFEIFENQINSYRNCGRLYVKCPKYGEYSSVKFVRKE